MQVIYAFRRNVFYPYVGTGWELPPDRDIRRAYLKKVREIGFDGVELGYDHLPHDDASLDAIAQDLKDTGVPCSALRSGGGLSHPRVGEANRRKLINAIRLASRLGTPIVNTALTTPPTDPKGPGLSYGETVSQGGSRQASEYEFEVTARALQEASDVASIHGVTISIEVHQRSIADNAWATLHLLDLVGRDNVGANPDLGNIYWCYDEPEERLEDAIVALAPRARYWHCKNMFRIFIPELQRSIFVNATIPDGEIDYRFAITAMVRAGYQGPIALEGKRHGDQLHGDARSLNYIRGILRELGAE